VGGSTRPVPDHVGWLGIGWLALEQSGHVVNTVGGAWGHGTWLGTLRLVHVGRPHRGSRKCKWVDLRGSS
jgi:hypothetical protein